MIPVREAKDKVKRLLRSEPTVQGVGITWQDGRQCVLVNVSAGADAVRERIRAQLPDVEVVVQKVGEITTE
jgi:hypothetical protein